MTISFVALGIVVFAVFVVGYTAGYWRGAQFATLDMELNAITHRMDKMIADLKKQNSEKLKQR